MLMGAGAHLAELQERGPAEGQPAETQPSRSWHPCGRLNEGPKDVQALSPSNFGPGTSPGKGSLQRWLR